MSRLGGLGSAASAGGHVLVVRFACWGSLTGRDVGARPLASRPRLLSLLPYRPYLWASASVAAALTPTLRRRRSARRESSRAGPCDTSGVTGAVGGRRAAMLSTR